MVPVPSWQQNLVCAKELAERSASPRRRRRVAVVLGMLAVPLTAAGVMAVPGAAAAAYTVPATVGALAVNTSSLPDARLGAAYSQTLAAIGGIAPYTWSVVPGSGSLPAGLSLNAGTGVISRTPTAAGRSVFTVQVTDPVSVSNATGLVLLGGASDSPCGVDAIGGPVTLTGNTGGVLLTGTTISGPASITGNGGGTVVAGNHINGPLSCSGNNPAPTDSGQPNTVNGPASGQCSGLA